MITIRHLSKRFGKLRALDDVSLTLEAGHCVALIGPNGCGKTTLIKAILGMVIPDSGEILFDSRPVGRDETYKQHIGYMPQIGRYPENMTIGQVVELIRRIRQYPGATDDDLSLAFGLPQMLEKKMRTLSGGTTQKVSAILAFLFRPKVLILDEPTAGLDPLAAEILKEKIIRARNSGCLVLITSHLLPELEDMVDQVVFMQEGRLILHEDVQHLKLRTRQETIARSLIHLLKTSRA